MCIIIFRTIWDLISLQQSLRQQTHYSCQVTNTSLASVAAFFFITSFLTLQVKNSPTKSSLCQSGFTSLPLTSSGSSCSSMLLYRFSSCLRSPVYRPGTVPPRRTELPPAPPVCAGQAVRYTDRAWRVCVWANPPLWPGRWSMAERGRSLPEPAGPTSRAPRPRPSSPPSRGSPRPGRGRSRSPGRRGGTGEPRRRSASDWLLLKNNKCGSFTFLNQKITISDILWTVALKRTSSVYGHNSAQLGAHMIYIPTGLFRSKRGKQAKGN